MSTVSTSSHSTPTPKSMVDDVAMIMLPGLPLPKQQTFVDKKWARRCLMVYCHNLIETVPSRARARARSYLRPRLQIFIAIFLIISPSSHFSRSFQSSYSSKSRECPSKPKSLKCASSTIVGLLSITLSFRTSLEQFKLTKRHGRSAVDSTH